MLCNLFSRTMELCNVTSISNTTFISNVSSGCNEENVSLYRRHIIGNILGSFFTLIIAVISIIGNVAVVFVSFSNETLRAQTGNLLIVYLSCVDILTGLFVMIPSAIAVASDYWPLGDSMCKFHVFLSYMFACSSSVNLAVISIDRAVAVVYPFKYQIKMTTKVMLQFCGVIFVVSFLAAAACSLPDWTGYNYSEGACAMEYTSDSVTLWYIFNTAAVGCYYTPVAILSVCNIVIIKAARNVSKSVQPVFKRRSNVANSLKETIENESHMKKTIKSLIVVVVTYYICFSPYALCKQVKVLLGIDMSPRFNYISTIFIYIASATNPFIYAILRKDYQDAFKKLLKLLTQKFLF